MKNIVIYGGGTISRITNQLAICNPSYGKTATTLAGMFAEHPECQMTTELRLTRMAGGNLETNRDIADDLYKINSDPRTKVVIMSATFCDFYVQSVEGPLGEELFGDNEKPLNPNYRYSVELRSASKMRNLVRENRKDIFFVAFKTTFDLSHDQMHDVGMNLIKAVDANLVLVNDSKKGVNMIVTPDSSTYQVTENRQIALRSLVDLTIRGSSSLDDLVRSPIDGVYQA